jgi:hypothetical protein
MHRSTFRRIPGAHYVSHAELMARLDRLTREALAFEWLADDVEAFELTSCR